MLIGETYALLRKRGIEIIAADSPTAFQDDTPTAKLIRQVLGAISEFDKAMTVAKLRGARDRLRTEMRKKVEGRKSHSEQRPEVVAIAKQTQLLRRFLDAHQVIRRYAPRVTGAGCQLLIFIALETLDRKSLRIPRLRDVTRQLDLSPSGASRLLETLTVRGRKDSAREEGGYGLIETDDFIEGRRTDGYVLTERGRKCIEEVLGALAARPCASFEPHDLGSLFKLMMAEWQRRPNNEV
jgi:DNA-binding MarR family transcriptional regulator